MAVHIAPEKKYDLSVIIPTYNENDNIEKILRAVERVFNYFNLNGEILVVDDNSPDETPKYAQKVADVYEDIRIIVRLNDKGLSQSVVEGFRQAKSDILVVMDADFSHPPMCVHSLYNEIKNNHADIAIGSRYQPGGIIKGWGWQRSLISGGATAIARILFPDIKDPVSGFFAVRADILNGADLRPSGYKILTEILGKCTYDRVVELPYKFINRKSGESKLGLKQILEYVIQIADIIAHAATNHNTKVWEEVVTATRFALVGTSGIFVNLMVLYSLVEWGAINSLFASFVAIEVAIISNFLLNDKWTFVDSRKLSRWKRFYSFHAVSFGGLLINFAIFAILIAIGAWYIFAQLIGIFIAFAWNFVVNRRRTWAP